MRQQRDLMYLRQPDKDLESAPAFNKKVAKQLFGKPATLRHSV